MEQRLEDHSKGEEKESSDEGALQEESIEEEGNKVETSNKQRSPWQTTIYHLSTEEEMPSQLEDIVEEETS